MAKVILQISLEYKAYEKLDELAKKKKSSKSELVREAVDTYLLNK